MQSPETDPHGEVGGSPLLLCQGALWAKTSTPGLTTGSSVGDPRMRLCTMDLGAPPDRHSTSQNRSVLLTSLFKSNAVPIRAQKGEVSITMNEPKLTEAWIPKASADLHMCSGSLRPGSASAGHCLPGLCVLLSILFVHPCSGAMLP